MGDRLSNHSELPMSQIFLLDLRSYGDLELRWGPLSLRPGRLVELGRQYGLLLMR